MRTCPERRYSTADLLIAEHELLNRAKPAPTPALHRVAPVVVDRSSPAP